MFSTSGMDALTARLRARREPLGLNVRFINSDGRPDCYSFGNKARADAFRAKLAALGREVLP